MIDITDIDAARGRIAERIRRTPVVPLTQLKGAVPSHARVTLKLECFR